MFLSRVPWRQAVGSWSQDVKEKRQTLGTEVGRRVFTAGAKGPEVRRGWSTSRCGSRWSGMRPEKRGPEVVEYQRWVL